MGHTDPLLGEALFNNLLNIFPYYSVMEFAIDLDNGEIDDCIINLLVSMDENGTVSYGMARKFAEIYDIEQTFLDVYGIAGDWENVEDGTPIGVDVGELLTFIRKYS
jgi:hypothetical protein